MQAAVATATLSATTQPSTECPSVELADPAAGADTPTTATGCRLATTTAAADQNSNLVAEMETNHNHHDVDSFDDAVGLSQPSTLTLRLIMQGKVRQITLCLKKGTPMLSIVICNFEKD